MPAQVFFDIPFTTGSKAELRDIMVAAAHSNRTRMLVTPNVDHVVALAYRMNEATRATYLSADLFVCDSKIVGAMARITGRELSPRAGVDVVADILEDKRQAGLVIAVAGPALSQIETLRRQYPDKRFIHIDVPQRVQQGSPDWQRCVDEASAGDWQVLLSCLSMPKQELFASDVRAARSGRGGLIMCVGATVNFLTGIYKRAPRFMQALGLEWLHRLMTNPRYLWRRYLIEGPKIFLIFGDRLLTGHLEA